ncbi:MAG: aldehyde dehydrogenase family protein, partial [Acidimicrobiales bacterium]
MAEISMTIDGTAVPTADTFGVVNPATGEVQAQAPDCTKEQLDAAFESSSKAYRDWKADEALRRELLGKAADAMFAAAGELGPILMAEQGKPLNEAATEAFAAGIWFKYYADL